MALAGRPQDDISTVYAQVVFRVGSLKQELASFRSRVSESKQLSVLELSAAAASGASLVRV
jgi:hypothetical protein